MGKFKRGKFYRLNQFIQAREVRVVDEKGKQVGVLSLSQALAQAQNQGLDLVEVASNTQPPVCKIIDFKKFKYIENKKNKGKKVGKSEIKEFRIKPFIAENDLKTRLDRARKFLKTKNKVRFTVIFQGRQIARKEFGYDLLKLIIDKLADCAQISQEPKFVGRQLIMILRPNEKEKQKAKAEDKKVNQKKV